MDSRGQVIIYTMMVGLLIILLGLYLAPSVTEFTNSTMVSMQCNNSSISNFVSAACIAVDVGGFYFIGALILIGGAFITIKIIL